MKDKEKLIKKTQVKRFSERILGMPQNATKQSTSATVDEEIFDDTDFYQQLLKDLVESNANSKGIKLLFS